MMKPGTGRKALIANLSRWIEDSHDASERAALVVQKLKLLGYGERIAAEMEAGHVA